MKISEIGEFGLIERLKDVLRSGIIGDDTAPVQLGDSLLLLTLWYALGLWHKKAHP